MVTSEGVKRLAKQLGADLCGIASMDRFEGAPKEQDPRYIQPTAKSCIVLAFRIPRGYLRGNVGVKHVLGLLSVDTIELK